jgi:hypothetical protein
LVDSVSESLIMEGFNLAFFSGVNLF